MIAILKGKIKTNLTISNKMLNLTRLSMDPIFNYNNNYFKCIISIFCKDHSIYLVTTLYFKIEFSNGDFLFNKNYYTFEFSI